MCKNSLLKITRLAPLCPQSSYCKCQNAGQILWGSKHVIKRVKIITVLLITNCINEQHTTAYNKALYLITMNTDVSLFQLCQMDFMFLKNKKSKSTTLACFTDTGTQKECSQKDLSALNRWYIC